MEKRKDDIVTMQRPKLAYVVHSLPGEPIELHVLVDGRREIIPLENRNALAISAALSQAVARNICADDRRILCTQPRAGSRG